MKAEEKALRLCQQYGLITFATKHNDGYTLPLEMAKQCALIAVDEIIKSGPSYPYDIQFDSMPHFRSLKYYEEVKNEIQKL